MIIWAVLSVYPTRSRRTHALPYMYLMYLREAEVSLQCPSYSSALAADLGYGVVAHATDHHGTSDCLSPAVLHKPSHSGILLILCTDLGNRWFPGSHVDALGARIQINMSSCATQDWKIISLSIASCVAQTRSSEPFPL